MNSTQYALVGLAASAVLVLSISAITASMAAMPSTTEDSPLAAYKESKKYRDYQDGVFKVRAGAGSHIAPLTKFYPYKAEIKTGESVVWYNPTHVAEPHTVSFVSEQKYWANIEAPFVLSNATQFVSAIPGANAEPVVMDGPNGTSIIVAANARLFTPTVITSNGTVSYKAPNASYSMDGSESYVNSGWIWPSGLAPEGVPPIDSFTVKFENPGTYDYICIIHPWMTGQVVVS